MKNTELVFYRMRYQVPIIETIDYSLIEAFELASNEFYRGSSCCQIIIDEQNKIIYSLDEDEYLSPNFEYELSGSYKVLNAKYFSTEDMGCLEVLDSNFKGK